MINRALPAILLALLLSPVAVAAQDVEATHNDIRALRDDMVDAVNKNDIDRLVGHLSPNVVVTFDNAEVARGRDGVRAYYEKMTKGPNAIVADYKTTVNVDELTTLYGDATGVAAGSADDKFTLSSGMTLGLQSRWTATLVKDGGKWEVAAFHASVNMFDNPIIAKMKGTMYLVGAFGLVMGIIVGAGVAMFLARRKRTA